MKKRLPHKVKTILIVENHPIVGAFLVDLLKTATPHHALLVADEIQALEVIKTITPDLFLLDDGLPQMNGLELVGRLQSVEELKQVPTLLLSSNTPIREMELRRLAFIQKPFSAKELLHMLGKLLEEW